MKSSITSISAVPWEHALRSPFRIAKRTAYSAQNVLVTITDASGRTGHGEAAPVEYVTGETVEGVVRSIGEVEELFEGVDASRIGPALDKAQSTLADAPSTRAALEMALLDLWGKTHEINLWHYFGGRKDAVVTDITIPIVGVAEATELTAAAVADGFLHFKVKVGDPEGHEADMARIRAVSGAAPQAGIRIDANQAFTPDAAIRFANELVDVSPHVELLEQPVAKDDFAGLKYVRERVSIPVFADEAAQSPSTVRRLVREGCVDGINIKLMKCGLVGALEIIEICRTSDIKLMIGCMLESRLSLTAAAYIAAGTGAISIIDLDSHHLLKPAPLRIGGFVEDGPYLRIAPAGYGWGIVGICAE